jgi:6-phosphogluconolactonase (cycloisomerase 2 family)
VTNNQNGTVKAFTIGATGDLTSMTTTTLSDPFDTSTPKQAVAPYAIAIDSTGTYAYVCSQVGNSTANAIISQFNINQSSGALEYNSSMMMGSTYITPWDIKIASIASGQYVYVTNHQNSTLWEYKINSDGTLSSIGTVSVAAAAHNIAIHPTGKYAYVTMFNGTTPNTVIAQLNINQSDGTLSLMSTPSISAGGTAAEVIAIDPTGKYAYSTSADSSWGSSSISQFTIDQTTGALTLMSTPTVQTHGTGPGGIVVVWK